MTYNVYIDKINWGSFTSDKTKEEFRNHMQESLKTMHPINSSEAGARLYRKRFEGMKVYVYQSGEKAVHLDKYK